MVFIKIVITVLFCSQFERFLPSKGVSVASVLAPIGFPPSPVLVFKESSGLLFVIMFLFLLFSYLRHADTCRYRHTAQCDNFDKDIVQKKICSWTLCASSSLQCVERILDMMRIDEHHSGISSDPVG